MKQTTKLLGSVLFTALFAGSALAEIRTWTDVRGRQVTASFVSIEADNITLQTADGNMHRFPLSNLSAEDQVDHDFGLLGLQGGQRGFVDLKLARRDGSDGPRQRPRGPSRGRPR